MSPFRSLLALLAVGPGLAWAASVTVAPTAHHGWTKAWRVANAQVEVLVVPEIGRVMQFRFVGADRGPFWENPRLRGKPMPAKPWESEAGSFGGDKTWPAPQSAWNWPPPETFDSVALAARVDGARLILTSPICPRFGLRTERVITVEPDLPVLRIITTYEKVRGEPVDVSVWVITQLEDPVATYLPVPNSTKFPGGTTRMWNAPTDSYTVKEGLLTLRRDRRESRKVGNDAESLVWIGPTEALRIDIPRKSGAEYPDDGCSAEIYTNPDPAAYVELETLGPLRRLRIGDRLSATNTYTLFRRTLTDPEAEARRILAR